MTDRLPTDMDFTEPFDAALARHGLKLARDRATILQINVGLLCNQVCRHCHLDAGPQRTEIMDRETVDQVIDLAQRFRFNTIDITGGAPEMNPHIEILLDKLAPLADTLILRSNLTAINEAGSAYLMELCRDRQVTIAASFPSINGPQTESQRGPGVFDRSLATLQKLNALGYGRNGAGLELNLISNPAGAFIPTGQQETEKRFRQVLKNKWDITFSNMYTFANVPLGRFRNWLEQKGNLAPYLRKLAESFNPCAVEGLMCRSLISVSWDGYLFDCDFNQAPRLHMGGGKTHITELAGLPGPGSGIAMADHCYTCTAGSGFT